jgi:hypothetical protein
MNIENNKRTGGRGMTGIRNGLDKILCKIGIHKFVELRVPKAMSRRNVRGIDECSVCGKCRILKPWGYEYITRDPIRKLEEMENG